MERRSLVRVITWHCRGCWLSWVLLYKLCNVVKIFVQCRKPCMHIHLRIGIHVVEYRLVVLELILSVLGTHELKIITNRRKHMPCAVQ